MEVKGQLSTGKFEVGNVSGYLAKAKDVFIHVSASDQSHPCTFEGTPDDFLKTVAEGNNNNNNTDGTNVNNNNSQSVVNVEDIKRQMKNKIKKCPQCQKPNGFTLSTCNGCGSAELASQPVSYTNNIFSSFLYGIQKGPFPFTVSLRSQSPQYLVFDDLLSLSPIHLNVIPTSQYLPDWRFLLTNPTLGKQIVNDLFNECWNVTKNQFLNDDAFKSQIFDFTKGIDEQSLKQNIGCGFNYPPSQYQLHLQFIVPPLLPFQYYLYLQNVHFTFNRFFPIEYVLSVLDLLIKDQSQTTPVDNAFVFKEEASIEELIEYFKKRGVDYDKIWGECYKKYGEAHVKLAKWRVEDFEYSVVGDNYATAKVYKSCEGEKKRVLGEEVKDVSVKTVNEEDKMVLQNYGRPYKKNGDKLTPSGTYYKYAKDPRKNEVKSWY